MTQPRQSPIAPRGTRILSPNVAGSCGQPADRHVLGDDLRPASGYFLIAMLGTSTAAVGVIEGTAEDTTSA